MTLAADTSSIEDSKFDSLFPAGVRAHSELHWTPVAVAEAAAKYLATQPGTRVLDVGSGSGKFCLVAASLSDGHFIGVEQRANLVATAQTAAAKLQLQNVEFHAQNILEISFADFDSFYLYNPFAENEPGGHKIDRAVKLSLELRARYVRHARSKLGVRPLGTRVVSYAGFDDEIPDCYVRVETSFGGELKFWEKMHGYDDALDRLRLKTGRSYSGEAGWAAPRQR
jgi:SAM-dependent methyltransferase